MAPPRHQLVSPRDLEILQAIAFYRFMTAMDVAYLLFSPTIATYVRAVLKRLSGQDYEDGRLLYRFRLPSAHGGNPQRVYTLGKAGQKYCEEVLGLPVGRLKRPERSREAGYLFLHHNLTLTKFLVAARAFARGEISLTAVRTAYELSGVQKIRELPAVPDCWLLFESTAEDWRVPVLLEIDRGTEYQAKFKEHVKARLQFIQEGGYKAVFQVAAATIVYLTTISEARREVMVRWTEEALEELEMQDWGQVCKFGYVDAQDIYTLELFTKRMWRQPFNKSPVSLFD